MRGSLLPFRIALGCGQFSYSHALSLCLFVALSIDLNLALHYASRNSGSSIIQIGNSGHINQANQK